VDPWKKGPLPTRGRNQRKGQPREKKGEERGVMGGTTQNQKKQHIFLQGGTTQSGKKEANSVTVLPPKLTTGGQRVCFRTDLLKGQHSQKVTLTGAPPVPTRRGGPFLQSDECQTGVSHPSKVHPDDAAEGRGRNIQSIKTIQKAQESLG